MNQNGVSFPNGNHSYLENGNYKDRMAAYEADPKNLGDFGNQENPYTYDIVEETAQYILQRTAHRPRIGIVCGSGLGGLAELLQEPIEFPYEEIPNFPVSTVPGHAGKLVIGILANVSVVCMQGRFHSFEGYPLWKCAMPVRVMKLMGVTQLILTNAAGGLNPAYRVGDIMVMKDHVNMLGFGGNSPLIGPNDDRFGPRFPPMNNAYDLGLRGLAKDVAKELGLDSILHEGVYVMVGGPAYETVTELRLLRLLGVDAVGMSTVPEVLVARHCGIRLFAFSLVTNECIIEYDCSKEANHEEVMDTARMRQTHLKEFVTRMVEHMSQEAK